FKEGFATNSLVARKSTPFKEVQRLEFLSQNGLVNDITWTFCQFVDEINGFIYVISDSPSNFLLFCSYLSITSSIANIIKINMSNLTIMEQRLLKEVEEEVE